MPRRVLLALASAMLAVSLAEGALAQATSWPEKPVKLILPYRLLGHSFGAIIATWHAIHLGRAAAYVISGGGDSSDALMKDVDASLVAMGEAGKTIADSWEREQHVRTDEELAQITRDQMPFHFAGTPPDDFGAATIHTPDVLRHFASAGYGDFDFRPALGSVERPTLVITGRADRTTTARAAQVLHDGIQGSELVVLEGAGHMSFVESQDAYLDAVRRFLRGAAFES